MSVLNINPILIKEFVENHINNNIDLSSFDVKSTLNQSIWDKNKLRPEIKRRVLIIAKDFYNFLKINAKIKDIVITGSLANYNWFEDSDLDVHIIINYEDVSKDTELVKNYFESLKKIWTDSHDIKIKGYDLELYVEDAANPAFSTGVYSLKKNDWIAKPEKIQKGINKDSVIEKIKVYIKKIKRASNSKNIEELKKIKDDLKIMRKKGLKKDGEMSDENIVFKYLRRKGYIETLLNNINTFYDKEMTLEQFKEIE